MPAKVHRVPEYEIEVDGQKVMVAQREYEIWELLRARKGQPITSTDLEEALTGEVLKGLPGHWARITVNRLKSRLRDAGVDANRYVRNSYGMGYYFVDPKAGIPTRTGKLRNRKD